MESWRDADGGFLDWVVHSSIQTMLRWLWASLSSTGLYQTHVEML